MGIFDPHIIFFKHVKLFNFPVNISLDQQQESPNQHSYYQEKLSRRPLGLGVLALPEDHSQRYQAKQPSQVFSNWCFNW